MNCLFLYCFHRDVFYSCMLRTCYNAILCGLFGTCCVHCVLWYYFGWTDLLHIRYVPFCYMYGQIELYGNYYPVIMENIQYTFKVLLGLTIHFDLLADMGCRLVLHTVGKMILPTKWFAFNEGDCFLFDGKGLSKSR